MRYSYGNNVWYWCIFGKGFKFETSLFMDFFYSSFFMQRNLLISYIINIFLPPTIVFCVFFLYAVINSKYDKKRPSAQKINQNKQQQQYTKNTNKRTNKVLAQNRVGFSKTSKRRFWFEYGLFFFMLLLVF